MYKHFACLRYVKAARPTAETPAGALESRKKLLRGIEHACVKRPVPTDAVERVLDRVERWLQETGEKEVASERVGDKVMEELTLLDALAAVRFASVFRDFQSTDAYAAFFESVEAGRTPPGRK